LMCLSVLATLDARLRCYYLYDISALSAIDALSTWNNLPEYLHDRRPLKTFLFAQY